MFCQLTGLWTFKNRLNVCEKEELPCFLYLIQIFGLGRNRECKVHFALSTCQTAHKPVSTSLAKQATGTKTLLCEYICTMKVKYKKSTIGNSPSERFVKAFH